MWAITDTTLEPAPHRALAACPPDVPVGVVVRDKHLPDDDRLAIARDIRATLTEAGVPHVLIYATNNPTDTTPEPCDGLHYSGTALAQLRQLPPGIHGASCHTPDDIPRSAAIGLHYVTYSPAFPSLSKPGHGTHTTISPTGYHQATTTHPHVIALGGITEANAGTVAAAGVHGVAVVGRLWGCAPDDVASVIRALHGVFG